MTPPKAIVTISTPPLDGASSHDRPPLNYPILHAGGAAADDDMMMDSGDDNDDDRNGGVV